MTYFLLKWKLKKIQESYMNFELDDLIHGKPTVIS